MATRTWDNGGGDGLWSTAANWSSNTKPVAGDSVIFDGTSTANCTIDEAINVADFNINAGYTYSAGVSGTITSNTGLTHAITGNLSRAAVGKIVFGSGTTWNIAGSFDSANTGPLNRDDYSGATVNLSGSSKTFGIISCAGAGRGTVNVQAGASYSQSEGEIGGVDFYNYGTMSSAGELNIHRNTTKNTRIYDGSTAAWTGAGTIIFGGAGGSTTGPSWLVRQGTMSIRFGIIKPNSAFALIPGTYSGVNWYRQGNDAHQIFYFSAGTYVFTGTWTAIDDGFTGGDTTINNAAGATISVAGDCNISTAGGGWLWVSGNGRLNITATGTLTSNLQALDALGVSTGTVTLGDNLTANGIYLTGGTLAGNSKTVTLRDQFTWTGGGITGVAGKTWTVKGSLYWSGITATAASAWTIACTAGPAGLYTANADTCTIDHVTVTGLTLQASHSTDSGNNSGITFSNTARQVTTVLARSAATLAAGAHTVEADSSSTTLTARLDGVQKFTATITTGATRFGLQSYFDGSYTLCPLDNFDVPLVGVPAAPASLAVSTAGLATWHVSTGATSYTLEESSTGSGAGFSAVSTAQSGVSYQRDISALYGMTRYYRVKATNAAGSSSYSSETSVTYPTLTLILDHFAGTNGDSVNGRTPDTTTTGGATWTTTGGATTIQSNSAQIASGGTSCTATIDAGNATQTVSCKISSTANGLNFRDQRIWGRVTDTSNLIGLRWRNHNGYFELYKRVAAVDTILADTSASPSTVLNTGDTISLTFSGNTVTAKLNGVTIMTVTESFNNTATKCGINGSNNTIGEVIFDDFQVTTP